LKNYPLKNYMKKKCKKCNKTFSQEKFIIFKYGKKKIQDVCRKCRYNRKTMIQFHIYRVKNNLC